MHKTRGGLAKGLPLSPLCTLAALLVCTAVAVALLGTPVSLALGAEVRLMSTDYPPYFAAELPNGGPLTEIVTTAFNEVDYNVDIKFVPWNRAMEYAKDGKVEGLHGGWHSKKRETWFVFSDPLPGNELVFYKRDGARPEKFTSYEDLRPFTIGVVKAYRNPKAFETAGLNTDSANSDQTNLRKLANGRIDLILIDRAVAEHILSTELTEYKDQLVALEPPVERLSLHILISRKVKNHLDIVNDFNRGLMEISSQGKISEILEMHGLTLFSQ